MKCPMCGDESNYIFTSKILNKYDVKYFQCPNCGLVHTETPYWIEEAYSSAIASLDTGVITRDIFESMKLSTIIRTVFKANNKILDYGAGHGVLTRLMRDLGLDVSWFDKYAIPDYAHGFEWKRETNVDVLYAIEVFEHFIETKEEIDNLLSISDTVIFSTLCYDKNLTYKDESWWYYSQLTGQHVSIYSERTLRYIASENGLFYYKMLGLHILTKKPINMVKRVLCNIRFYSGFFMLEWLVALARGHYQKDYIALKKRMMDGE